MKQLDRIGLSLPVRIAVNLLYLMGLFLLIVGVLQLIKEPAKWYQWTLSGLGTAFCIRTASQAKHGEGFWLDVINLHQKNIKP